MSEPVTKLINPKELKLPSDYKVDPAKLEWMMSSIKTEGIIHAPCVKDNNEVFVGKLRIAACRANGIQEVECKVYPSNLTNEFYEGLSLHENLKRYNLPWYEQVIMEKRLHDIRQDKLGKGKQGAKTGWSLRDTAAELNMSFGVLSEDIRMAEAIIQDPTLRRIEDKTTAKKIILDAIKRSNQEIGASIPSKVEINTCHLGGSETLLRVYPDCCFDACITDPPWLEFKDESLTRDEFTLPVFKEIFRTLTANSFLYAFVSTQDWVYYQEKLTVIGFSVQKWPLIWHKDGVLTHGATSWQHQRNYEPILVAVKGVPALTKNMCSSVLTTKVVPSGKMIHPNEKPDEVIKCLIEFCTYPGSIVLDPFAGSFVVPATCKQMNRRYVAMEVNPKFYAKGLERLK
jgi:hypothetical protein